MSMAQRSFDRVWRGTSNFLYPGVDQGLVFKGNQDRTCRYIRSQTGRIVGYQTVSKDKRVSYEFCETTIYSAQNLILGWS